MSSAKNCRDSVLTKFFFAAFRVVGFPNLFMPIPTNTCEFILGIFVSGILKVYNITCNQSRTKADDRYRQNIKTSFYSGRNKERCVNLKVYCINQIRISFQFVALQDRCD